MAMKCWEEVYREVRSLRPDLYRRVVEMGHIPVLEVMREESGVHRWTRVGAKVEEEVMRLVLCLLKGE